MDTPVLLTVFNRRESAMTVLGAIRRAAPSRLFIAADGPREERPGEDVRCSDLRKELLAAVDWPCEVRTLFRDRNLGCGRAMAGAVDWFFSEVEEGIILEDDCVPGADFFRFATAALDFYRDEERVMCINGAQFFSPYDCGGNCAVFSMYAQIWGWAAWRRAWRSYDYELSKYDPEVLRRVLPPAEAERMDEILRHVRRHDPGFDTWDFQWSYAVLRNNGVALSPRCNLIGNIGFGGGTHDMESLKGVENLSVSALPEELIFPAEVAADSDFTRKVFNLFYRKKPLWRRILARLGRWGR